MLKRSQTFKNLYIGVAITLLLLFLHFLKVLAPLETYFIKFTMPALSKLYDGGTFFRKIYEQESDRRDLSSEISKNKEQIEKLIFENSKLKTLEEENENLRTYLNFIKNTNSNYLMADVISRSGVNSTETGQSLIINKGLKDGVKKGQVVVNSNGLVVGKISEVKEVSSQLYLTTSQKCKIAASIQNSNKTNGIVEGDLGLVLKMGLIPQTSEIKPGDIVFTSGLEENIPRGLVIGVVYRVNKENNELWQTAAIEPSLDPNDLSFVAVITQKK